MLKISAATPFRYVAFNSETCSIYAGAPHDHHITEKPTYSALCSAPHNCDHQPLYRQSLILERESGLEISRATLNGWVMRVGELLRPITGAMAQELLAGNYIQADETPVGVQSERVRGKNHQAYLWQYSRPGAAVVFDFRMGREREGPKRFLGNFEGILQSDGYAAYDHVGGPRIVHAACWAHARRKFFQAVELNPEDRTAIGIVAQIDELFAIDEKACQEALSREERHCLRLEKCKPLLDSIKSQIEAARSGALPKSVLAKACNYTLTLWTRLTRFLEYPVLELSNNLAENAIRPVALGRRNGSTSVARMRARVWQPSCRSWKPAGALKSRFETTSAQSSQGYPTFQSTGSRNSRPLPGPPKTKLTAESGDVVSRAVGKTDTFELLPRSASIFGPRRLSASGHECEPALLAHSQSWVFRCSFFGGIALLTL